MGFGIMFLGYFFMFIGSFTPLSIYTAIIGSAIILYSLKELIYQNKWFMASAVCALVLVISSVATVFVDLFASDTGLVYTVFFYSREVLTVILNILLMISIFVISKSVQLPKIQTKAIITLLFIGLYTVGMVLCNTALKANEFAQSRIYPAAVICQFISCVLGLVTVFNSYMRICYADDKDMTKKTGVAPMDFLNEKLNTAMTPKEKRFKDDRKNKK